MKHTLAENIKHILNEKYLLSERYILAEDIDKADSAGIDKTIEYLEKLPTVEDLQKKVKTLSAKDRFKTLQDTEKEFKESVDAADPYDTLSNIALKYITEFENLFKDADLMTNSYVKGRLKLLRDATNAGTVNSMKTAGKPELKTQTEELINEFNNLTERVNIAIQTSVAEVKISDELETLVNELNQAVKESILPDLQEAKASSQEVYEKYYKTAVEDLNKNVAKTLPDLSTDMLTAADHAFSDALKEIKTVLDTFITNFDKGMEAKRADEEKDAADKETAAAEEHAKKIANSQVYDWAALYKECHNEEDFKHFWHGNPNSDIDALKKGYFVAEWGEKAQAVDNFGIGFVNDLEEIGWDSITNPVLKFLKSDNIYLLLGEAINQSTYIKLHNALARHTLDLNDFAANDKSDFKESNIIYNTHLYTDNVDIDDYLQAQNTLRQARGSLSGLVANIFNSGQDGRRKVLNNLMLRDGDLRDWNKDTPDGGPFRELTRINQELKELGGEADNEKVAATDTNVQEALNQVTPAQAPKIIAYLVDALRLSNQAAVDEANKLTKTNGLYEIRNSPKSFSTYNETLNFNKILKLDQLNYSKKQLVSLLLGLAEKAGVYNP